MKNKQDSICFCFKGNLIFFQTSLDKVINDMDKLTNILTNKNDEIINKTQTINQLETIVK